MITEKWRFFLTSTGNKVAEKSSWILVGTENININDPRAVPIGEVVIHPTTGNSMDLWIPKSVSNPCFDSSGAASYQYKTVKKIDNDPASPTVGQTMNVQVPVKTLSSNFNFMSMPLKPGYTEINETQFNDVNYPSPPPVVVGQSLDTEKNNIRWQIMSVLSLPEDQVDMVIRGPKPITDPDP